jgi:hypothetical protein
MLNLWGLYQGNEWTPVDAWEHIDSVESEDLKEEVLAEYQMAFGPGWVFEWRH